ncbi:hypothetical protein [Microbacterium testaceum]|uniref:Uncharacterized protein n=1 Tax=Microbacterium testaceum TaxID=2033 RepID=A0A147F4J6_MICTE|nr:hypothetical protein [Microbacterium testaceum]KTS09051.1 hypothetical protein RSA3_14210 [Microbacterium testaceum]
MNLVTINGVRIEIEDDRKAAHVRQALVDLVIEGVRFSVSSEHALADGSVQRVTTVVGPGCDLLITENAEAATREENHDWAYAMIAWAREAREFRVIEEHDIEAAMEAVVELEAIREGERDEV